MEKAQLPSAAKKQETDCQDKILEVNSTKEKEPEPSAVKQVIKIV